MTSRWVVAGSFVVAIGMTGQILPAEKPSPSASPDCGTLALYYLLHLEGRPVAVKDLQSRLPLARPDGYSMKELRNTASTCGLRLSAVLLTKNEKAIDRPMLMFLKNRQHGHFSVVRPVGHTGKLAQIIDNLGPPEIVDKSDLFSSPKWTGLALIPSRTNWHTSFLSVMAAALIGMTVFMTALWKRRRS